MFKKLIDRFLGRRHYWRNIGFDELSELYTSMMFRSLAQSLVGIFVPIYFYQLGYAVWEIFFFYAMAFAAHTLAIYPVARLIAKYGPKHTILFSYVFQVMGMMMLVSQPELRWPLLVIAAAMGISGCLFFLAFHVDFSKVKHSEHGGKEVGWLFIMERFGAVLGPLIGGLVGFIFGGQYIFMTAVILLFAGIIPLFLTNEPTRLNQHLDFRGLHVKNIKYSLISHSFLNLENHITMTLWPLFVGIYVFSDNPYLKIGSMLSISVLLAIFVARSIGKIIDNRRGRQLLRTGAIANAILHLFRPFTGNYAGALSVNLANEVVTPAYRMPYVKGMYDAADAQTGRRIVYLSAMESVSTAARCLFFASAGIAAYLTAGSKNVFIVSFVIASLASLGIMLERFKALDP